MARDLTSAPSGVLVVYLLMMFLAPSPLVAVLRSSMEANEEGSTRLSESIYRNSLKSSHVGNGEGLANKYASSRIMNLKMIQDGPKTPKKELKEKHMDYMTDTRTLILYLYPGKGVCRYVEWVVCVVVRCGVSLKHSVHGNFYFVCISSTLT